LLEFLGKLSDAQSTFITSNCNCFSSSRKYSIASAELLDENCAVVKLPYVPLTPTLKYGRIKYLVTKYLGLYFFVEIARGILFFIESRKCDLVHFDQVLKSFGTMSFLVLLILSKLAGRRVVVTAHEVDPIQKQLKFLNGFYNLADRVIVHSKDMEMELQELGIEKGRIEVIPFGVRLDKINNLKREHFIFFGGHSILNGKGFETLLDALKILRSQGKRPKIVAYFGHNCSGVDEAKLLAAQSGLDDFFFWTGFLTGKNLQRVYQSAFGVLIPYTKGSARYPATQAMANATLVIGTLKAGLPEYVGQHGIYFAENSPEELAKAIAMLMDDAALTNRIGYKLRERAEQQFSWDKVGTRISDLYSRILAEK
jgi:glycosyltransferase involved in cell wall biosynthesis